MNRALVGRMFLSLPVMLLWVGGGFSHSAIFSMIIIVLWGVLIFWDSKRKPYRCPASYILAKMSFVFMCVLIPLLTFLFSLSPSASSNFNWFWIGFFLSYWLVGILLIFNMGAQTLAHYFLYPQVDEGYPRLRKTGFHPVWDRGFFGLFNPDNELIRRGGFQEPEYKGFVPPEHWGYQCPVCGVRLQHNPDVCWNCNYGADGDSTAYFKRYGHIDQNPRFQRPQTPERPPEQQSVAPVQPDGSYAPVEPR